MEQTVLLDINKIKELIPHRYPFLLVDKVVEMSDTKIVGIKNVTINEPFFAGHFPVQPIMPGVLIIEAMAQTACILSMTKMSDTNKGGVVYFMGIDNAKFRKPVVPGDQLRLQLEIARQRGMVFRFKGEAYAGDALAAEAEITAMLGNS